MNVQTVLVSVLALQVLQETSVTVVIPIIMVLQLQVVQPVPALLEELPCVTLPLVLVHVILDTLEIPVILVLQVITMTLLLILVNVRMSYKYNFSWFSSCFLF